MSTPTTRQQPTLDADIKSLQRELHERLSATKKVDLKSKASLATEQQPVAKAK
jgi:hypothetical protein